MNNKQFKSINAYIDTKGKKFICIKALNGDTIFINENLLKYVLENAKKVKENN